ncbi:MAG TPA: bifunctional oligoribonuclease/PAP phosphatase NrnA [Candidatus Methylomirabilis sp.]|nr:bifunctional oligoribonuclease/PAP phosphatase NrnA [Candidatus Methylomirabilis sp.]
MLDEVLNQIGRRQKFICTSHARPDGDAVGSALACCQILRSMGKQANVVLSDGVPGIYRPLPYADSVLRGVEQAPDADAAIILECDGIARTKLTGLDKHYLINIDHHDTARPFGHVNWIDPNACATAEMIFRLARQAGVKISPEVATCLYTAVLTDTGSFCFTGTTERTFALAQELVRCGADPVKIAHSVYFSTQLSKMRLLGEALCTLHKDGSLAWMNVTHRAMELCESQEEDCEGLVNYALAIQGIEVALFFREQADGRFRVSLRSKGAINVAKVAETFGGGGHSCASGCAIEGPLSVATERMIAQLRIRGFQSHALLERSQPDGSHPDKVQ